MLSMAASSIFGISSEGKLFSLSSSCNIWDELPYFGLDFKRVAATRQNLWAVGGDHQLYLFVRATDVPIRIKEIAYENQRWNPAQGFCSRLLPTDRYAFSSADGLVERNLEHISLPSSSWDWEDEWHLDLTLEGAVLDHEGWTYAVDFPRQYFPSKSWNSCVRRRKWVRNCRFIAHDRWAPIPPVHPDRTEDFNRHSISLDKTTWLAGTKTIKLITRRLTREPFLDIAVGGEDIPGVVDGFLCVWTVTVQGHVYFREDVHANNPEGSSWTHVLTPAGWEACQISVGPTGLVWMVAWNGKALARMGVTWQNRKGTQWIEVPSPHPTAPLCQACVGVNAVWAVTRGGTAWFRKGIQAVSEADLESPALLSGSGWVEMVGCFTVLALGPGDQVFAIDAEDRGIYMRTGVLPSELSGKHWQKITCDVRTFSNASSVDDLALPDISEPNPSQVLPTGDAPETEVGSSRSFSSEDTSLGYRQKLDDMFFQEDGSSHQLPPADWVWLAAGSCRVDPSQTPDWFSAMYSSQLSVHSTEQWRSDILEQLATRKREQMENFASYEPALTRSAWVKTGQARWDLEGVGWTPCMVEMEAVGTEGVSSSSGMWAEAGALRIEVPGKKKKVQVSLSEITCMVPLGLEQSRPVLAVYTERQTCFQTPPIRLSFSSDGELEDWTAHLTQAVMQVQGLKGPPNPQAIWAITARGDVFLSDKPNSEGSDNGPAFHTTCFPLNEAPTPLTIPLSSGLCPEGSVLIRGTVPSTAERFSINLQCGTLPQPSELAFAVRDVALHINPRFGPLYMGVVRNSQIAGVWGEEERDGDMPFFLGEPVQVVVACFKESYHIYVNGDLFAEYRHRLPFEQVTHLAIKGSFLTEAVHYRSLPARISLSSMVWRQTGGHLRHVASCKAGVVWGLGYDGTLWVHSGGYGGGAFKGIQSVGNIQPMTDTRHVYIYENQRWNPLTGFSSRGLPTDRYSWSDRSGRKQCTKENTKLPSVHWTWVSEWCIDYHCPEGVDKEGWQYATDFPATFHGNKGLLDYVRRRRWYRKCQIQTSGPWTAVGITKFLDVSMQVDHPGDGSTVDVWAIASNGDVLLRTGVTKHCPSGEEWEHVSSEYKFRSISVGGNKRVWAITDTGTASWRYGVSTQKPTGISWLPIDRPEGAVLSQISVGRNSVWVVSKDRKLYCRQEVAPLFPEGTSWKWISAGILHLSIGPQDQVWCVCDALDGAARTGWTGVLCKRKGITESCLEGLGWEYGVGGCWAAIFAQDLE